MKLATVSLELRALADPVLGALEFQGEIITLFLRQVSADFLDKFAVPRAAGIGNNNAVSGRVLGADAFHSNSDCHK